jgi:peptidoglycan/LPS O-acetylase OafA/YrhL
MRALMVALVAMVGLLAMPAGVQAMPAAPHDLGIGSPLVELVRDGCGAGWHARRWQDRWGRWHRRCVPNRW